MLFSRKALGVEISPAGVFFALMGGATSSPCLERVASRPLAPGVLRVSLREPNIHDTKAFSDRLNEAHALLLHRGTRLSASLPDAVGRILMLDVEGRFKSRSEGLDIIRWKLKKSMPFDIADTHLDYQVLQIRESGDMSLLVALVSRAVISQYEDSITSAGFVPTALCLNTLSLCRAFEQRLEQLEDVIVISFHESTLSIMVFDNGIPEFLRIKELAGATATDSRVFMEINNSLLVWGERFPERSTKKVACIAAPDLSRDFCGMVGEATSSEPVMLEVKTVVKPANAAPADQESLYPFTAAIGAALRSL